MSGMYPRRALVIIALLLAAAGLAAQQYEGTYDAVHPLPEDGQLLRLLVTPDDGGYRFLMVAGLGFGFECTSTVTDDYECAGEIDVRARVENGGEKLVIISDEMGPDPIRVQLYASGDPVDVNEFRGSPYGGSVHLQVFTTPTSEGLAMRWFMGEIYLDAAVAVSSDGALVGEAGGARFRIVVDGDQAVIPAGEMGYSEPILFARVLESRADEPVRTADVGPLFDDYTVAGDLESAFEAWSTTALPESAHASAMELAVVSRAELALGERFLGHLSPAGDLLISQAPSSTTVSVHESATGAEVVSFEIDDEFPKPLHFAWSPDGSEIAMAGDAGLFSGDPGDRLDIVLLSLAEGTATNITADEQVSADSIASAARKLDLAPLWVGSRQLVFERRSANDVGDGGSSHGGRRATGEVLLAELDLETRTVTMGAYLPAEPMSPIASALSFAPMSGELFADFAVPRGEDGGVRVIGPRERGVTMEFESPYWLSSELTAASFDGRYLLLVPSERTPERRGPEDLAFLYDRETDEFILLLPGEPDARHFLGAAFSPDGSKVVYLFRDLEAERDVLAVRDVDDLASEQVLVANVRGYPNGPVFFNGVPGLAWGANDRVMVPLDGHRRAMLLTLGRVRE